ncbi:MAG: putative acyl-CoA dehydrogenase [Betaproteobacteria bacterium]|nr:putative acyl-CoA dehydrogenase [Betaproteobacteria bacterium]
MNNQPDATELLAIARSTLLDKLLPRLPDDLRYDALMIANAMMIAAREHAAGDEPAKAEFGRACALLAEHPPEAAGAALQIALVDCNRRLAAGIRAGRYDKDSAALLAHLDQTAAHALAISNPRALGT